MKVILDTNFIVNCTKEGIDFLSQLEEQGFQILVPKEVLQELKDIRLKVSHDSRIAIDVALERLASKNVKKISLSKRSVDDGLIEKAKEGYYIATLDKAIKYNVPNRVVIFSAQKRVGVEG